MVGQRNEGRLAWLVIVGCECGGAEKCLEREREELLCAAIWKIRKKQSRITELNEQIHCESSLFFRANKLTFIQICLCFSNHIFNTVTVGSQNGTSFPSSEFTIELHVGHSRRMQAPHNFLGGPSPARLESHYHIAHNGSWHHIRLLKMILKFF